MITYFNSPVLKTSDMILIITIFFVLSSSSSHAQAAHNSSCNRVCGTQIQVQYPFGFSPGCEIQLNCSEHVTVQIGDFRVHNITNDNILVNVSAACDRPISTIKQLIRKNYAPTTRNNFLLQNCSKQLKGCFLEASLLEDRLQVKGCQTGSGNISCYLEENRGLKFTTFETLERTGCSSMFTSIAVDLVENRSVNSSGALEIQTLELGWLLQGKCKCVADADCTNVSLDGLQGFRCRCKTGFEGDGFVDGAGCRKGGSKGNKNEKVIISLTVSIGMILLGLSLVVCVLRKNQKKKKQMKQIQEERLKREAEQVQSKERQEEDLELPLLDFDTIAKATNYFSLQNKLGEGGFGPVYKGLLDDGKEIAVKRLSKNSRQGTKEFKNEVVCIAKLQHRNLVKLVGCCIEEEEKMLIYEYLPNRGLDFFIFDETRSKSFGWPTRFNIINGIARGLLYLHQDSRLRVIHRDLKVSNILLDKNLNPKISDFGMARIFGGDENEANTNRVVGTYGYMSPEYQLDGLFSVKSDVFSFGVIVLEIVTGKRNRRFFHPDHHHNLLGHVWNLYKEGKAEELVNKQLGYSGQYESEILRSIHIGLLCLQQDPEDRPNMSYVVMMLGSDIILPQPKQPGFFTERNNFVSDNSSSQNITTATNEVTVSLLDAG